jgi:NADH:ubiquinone oxidoreductase subunit F (NADH-binding)
MGSDEGYVYCRAEYPLAIERLEKALEQMTDYGLIGENILGSGFNFSLHIKEGAGAFVCGEETALMASIEGKRGMPRPRPPFPAVSGLWGKPTNINNVETWANAANIMQHDGEWYAVTERTEQGDQDLRPGRQDQPHRPYRVPWALPCGDHSDIGAVFPRQEVQGRPDRWSLRRLPPGG